MAVHQNNYGERVMLLKKGNGDVVDTKAPKYNLKVGMVVKIKPSEVVEKVHSEGGKFDAGFVQGMMKYCGKKAKIVRCFEGFIGGRARYFLNIDNEQYKWTIAMFDWENKLVFENE